MLIDIENLLIVIDKLKKQGKTIVSTNGCFDLLHYGHINYLERSKALGDVLIVLVNSDSSVRMLKSIGKPLNSEKIRAKSIAALKSVDYCVVFDDITPTRLLEIIKPDVHTKGADYSMLEMPERQVVEQNGGRVELIKFIPYSTTIDKVKFITED